MDIYSIILSKSINNHYAKKYYTFIKNCGQENSKKTPQQLGSVEIHHICPRGIFPEYASFKDNPWNAITLTLRQHLLSHWMSWKAFGHNQGFAFSAMLNILLSEGMIKVPPKSSRIYEILKKEVRQKISTNNSVVYYYIPGTTNFIRISKNKTTNINVPDGFVKGTPYARMCIYQQETFEEVSLTYPKYQNKPDIPDGWLEGSPSKSIGNKNRKAWYDPITLESKRLLPNETPPIGWILGSPKTKSTKNKTTYHDPDTNEYMYFYKGDQPSGWIHGIPQIKSKNLIGKAVFIDSLGNSYKLEIDSPLISKLGLRGANYNPEIVICPHCNRTGRCGGMKRHHFKNCKANPESPNYDSTWYPSITIRHQGFSSHK